MKKLFISVLAGLLALGVMAQGGKFTVTGQVKGQGNMIIYALTDAWGGAITNDMKFVTNDKVDFSFDLEEVGWLMVFNPSRLLYILPAIPGESVTINGDVDDYTVDGSPIIQEYNEKAMAIKALQEAIWKYDFKQECQGEIAGKSSEEVFNLYQNKLRDNYQPVNDAVMSFVREHPDHETSMMLVRFLNSAEDIERAGDIISEPVLDGRMNPYYVASLDQVKSTGSSNPFLNKAAPDFELNDINGKPLSLSSLRGKWVLLDFWSLSCDNAISQFPLLKEMYAKYKDHIEILGVDCEDDEEEWKSELMNNYRTPWLNVIGSPDDPQAPVNLYEETGTPAYYLIAPSGKVAKKSYDANTFTDIFNILFE